MRIVHVIASTGIHHGGPPRVALDTARVTHEAGHPTLVLTPDPTDTPADDLLQFGASVPASAAPKVMVLPVSSQSRGRFALAQRERVGELLRTFDVVHLHGVLNTGMCALGTLARQVGTPYAVTVHGVLDDWSVAQGSWLRSLRKRVFLRLVGRPYLERAAFVHCTSQIEADEGRKWFPRGKPAVLPLLMDMQPFRALPGPGLARERWAFLRTPGVVRVIFVGRLHYGKGVDILLEALAQVRHLLGADGPEVAMVFVGSGEGSYPDALKAQAQRLGLSDRAHFVGQVSGALKFSLYQACDIFALPTMHENFGLVYPEAMAAGLPVVTTKGTNIWPDLLRSGAVEIVERTPAAFASSIAGLARDSARRTRMGQGAPAWVLAEYDEATLLARLLGFYERAMHDSRR